MTDPWLKQVKERVEAATPGPCEVVRFDRGCGSISYQVESGFGKDHVVLGAHDDLDNPKAKADAFFEAYARTDIPKLLALVEQYEDALISIAALHLTEDKIKACGGDEFITDTQIAREALAQGEKIKRGE